MPNEELALLVDTLVKQVQGCVESQERLRQYVMEYTEKFHATIQGYVTKELSRMQGDVDDLDKKLEDMKQAIITNQEKKFKQTIALQSAILLAILAAALGYLVPLILSTFAHH